MQSIADYAQILPSRIITPVSHRIRTVVKITSMENMYVHTGSAILYSGCKGSSYGNKLTYKNVTEKNVITSSSDFHKYVFFVWIVTEYITEVVFAYFA